MASFNPDQIVPMFHIDVTAGTQTQNAVGSGDKQDLIIGLLRQLAIGQQQQNELLGRLVQMANATQRTRAQELGQWKEANPEVARRCRTAAEVLTRVHAQFLRHLTDEVADSEESLLDGEYMLNEFVDRFGARLAQLNGIIQVLSHLGVAPNEGGSA